MDPNRIAAKAAVERLRAADVCEFEAFQLAEWASAQLLTAWARVAVINGHPARDFQIPVRAWQEIMKHRGRFDGERGKLDVEFEGEPFTPEGFFATVRRFKVSATMVEFDREELNSLVPAQAIIRTGDPGRPSSAHLYLAEFERRRVAGTLERELATESAALHDWFKREHHDLAAPSVKTIKNRIREFFNAAKA